MTGTFYGVSVGPGDPELLTLKAVRILERCPVMAAPRTRRGSSLALEIARQALDLSGKEILYLDSPMTREEKILNAARAAAAAQILERLRTGLDVAMVCLGDVGVYSTFSYLARTVRAGEAPVCAVPGVTSFCAAAAALGTSLTDGDRPMHVIPGGYGQVEQALAFPGTKVLMKSGRELPEVCGALIRAGLSECTGLVANCGLPGEEIHRGLGDCAALSGYFTTLVVKDGSEL